MSKTAIIIGAGPAGLTAAYELLTKTNIKPIIFEATDSIGGIARNVIHNGNIIDLGGHRFFSKDKIINNIWQKFMPLQGKPTSEELITGWSTKLTENGPDPKYDNNVLLMRTRISRIYYLNHFFDYPLSINLKTIKNLGFLRAIKAGISYFKHIIIKKKESNLENFYINRFGHYLYKIFFETYTEKLWGRHPRVIDASWGKQRVKGLSLRKAILHAVTKRFKKDNQKVEGSLVGSFSYPKYGPGSLYEKMAKWCVGNGAKLYKNARVTNININNNNVKSITINNKGVFKADYVISSMPLKNLINTFNKDKVPKDISYIANNLPYRGFISVNLLMKDLKIHNQTKIKTINNRIPDNWIYIQQGNIHIGRIQILNNWSPYLVKDNINTTWIGLEFFASENEELWNSSDQKLIDLAIKEATQIGIIDKNDILDSTVNRIPKAYPAYFDSYSQIDKLIQYLNSFNNLYCVGRNGQHRYNNMDHSMLTAIKTVECIIGKAQKADIWKINTKQEYHES